MKFSCKECNYETNNNSNWCHHIKTQKHIDNIKENIKMHEVRSSEHNVLDIMVTCKDELLQEKDNQIKEIKKMLKKQENLVEYFKNLNVGKINNSLLYLIQNHISPPLSITQNEIKNLIICKNNIEDNLIFHYKERSLDDYIGKIILTYIKKENPINQSIWFVIDASDLTCVIAENANNLIQWVIDEDSEKFKKIIVAPILKYMKNLIKKREMHRMTKYMTSNRLKCLITNRITIELLFNLDKIKKKKY